MKNNEIEKTDFIINKILEIQDLDNIDPALMEKINQKEEYRTLLEECRNISNLVKESAPEPVCNGKRLSEALSERIAKGDTAPKYIHTSRRFPLATVACLAIAAVVVLTARSGIMNRAFDSAENMTQDYEADFMTEYETGGEAVEENATVRINGTEFKTYTYSTDDLETVTTDSANFRNDILFSDTLKEEAAEEPMEEPMEPVEEEATAQAPPQNAAGAGAALSQNKITVDFETAEGEPQILSENTLELLKQAKQLLGTDADVISVELICELGEESFISFFNSIPADSFSILYTEENFINYCK